MMDTFMIQSSMVPTRFSSRIGKVVPREFKKEVKLTLGPVHGNANSEQHRLERTLNDANIPTEKLQELQQSVLTFVDGAKRGTHELRLTLGRVMN